MNNNNKYYGLHNLISLNNARKKPKRVGRGESSGHGKTSTRGHKGQKSHKSFNIRIGFEGGQKPLLKRLPKIGFNNYNFKKNKYIAINLGTISSIFKQDSYVNVKSLISYGLISNIKSKIKILNKGDLKIPLKFKVHSASKAAIKKIKSKGGSINFIKKN